MPIKNYCKQCGHELECWSIGWHCSNCGCFEDMNGNIHDHKKEPFMLPKTNADKIRSMTDEELSKFLSHYLDCENCELSYIEDIWHETCCKGKHNECWKNLIEWLKQPVKGE